MSGRYDLAILGGGPAGYVPAIRAAQLGKKVALVEKDAIGGTCLNRGCIPTKTLIASASLYRHALASRKFGLSGTLDFDYADVARRKDMVVNRLRKGVEAHLKHLEIDVIRGHGRLIHPDTIEVEGREVKAGNILLAPGSKPLIPKLIMQEGLLTSREVLEMDSLPESMIIIGGGVIGCEFASVFSSFGVNVTIVEMLPKLLPGVDGDVAEVLERSLKKSKVKVHTGQPAASVEISPSQSVVTLGDGTVITAEKVLVSIGRVSKTEECGFQEAGLIMDHRGNIVTDANGLTNLSGVYAAGDATGKWQLAHAGSSQGIGSVHHMFGAMPRGVNPDAMSGCIFTFPEIAMVGPGEDEWRERGEKIKVAASRFIANGKAVGMNETDGFVKIISREKDDTIIGVQIVGADASSLIGWAVMAVNSGIKAADAASFVHPHPTLSELFMEASEGIGIGSLHG
ncbi:dihydrolipoyl dehydrogenase [Candidatus Fermentibacteria bacterium]|nr:MAG: dihydrolipoyl dehydrogenase [Candidatus Fermentibacteria bacterium]